MKISFTKKATVPLADSEQVSLWDDMSGGSLTLQDGHLCLAGTWRVSPISNFLGGGLLGVTLIRPFFQKPREEKVPIQDVDRIMVNKKWSGKKVYHVFQNRDGGNTEVHTFAAGAGTDDAALEQFLAGLVPADRFKRI